MPKHKIKSGGKNPDGSEKKFYLRLQKSSKKDKGGKVIDVYESGDSVELTPAQALSHASILELDDKAVAKLEKAASAEEESPKKK